MTSYTTRPQATFVKIVLMAILATKRGILEFLRYVASLARDHVMLADQWKPGDVVIKSIGLAPTGFVMAVRAFLAELLFMHIVFAVA